MIGGFGNQMHLFVFTYLLSTLEKIPLYCIIYPPFSTILLDPKESAFGTFFNIHSFFPDQLHPIPQKEYNQMINNSTNFNKKVLNYNIFTYGSFKSYLGKNKLCTGYKQSILYLTGYDIITDTFYQNEAYIPILKELNMYWEDIYKHKVPAHQFRYEYHVLADFMLPTEEMLEFMETNFPNYNTSDYLSVHLRYGSSMADFRDTQPRLARYKLSKTIQMIRKYLRLYKYPFAYVASDSNYAKTFIRDHMRGKVMILQLGLLHHTDAKLNRKPETMRTSLKQAIGELLLLSYGKACIGTALSSYSYIACANVDMDAIILKPDISNA